MKFKVRFLCEDNMLMIKFNSNRDNSNKWLDDLADELYYYIKNEIIDTPYCGVEFLMWSIDNTGEGITFLVNCDINMSSFNELEDMLYTNFRECDLLWITQPDITNFTYNNEYWAKLINNIKENMSGWLGWLHPMLERVKIELIEE